MRSKYKIKLSFFAILLFLSLAITAPHYFPALLCSVSLHELGHVIAAKIRKIRLLEFKLGILGAAIFPKNQLFSYKDEIILCLGGPVANFITAGFCVGFGMSPASFFIQSSLALGILNMLPVHSFDGGRILSALLHMCVSERTAGLLCKIVSFTVLFSLWCISVYLLLRRSATLSLFIFSASVFVKLFINKS